MIRSGITQAELEAKKAKEKAIIEAKEAVVEAAKG